MSAYRRVAIAGVAVAVAVAGGTWLLALRGTVPPPSPPHAASPERESGQDLPWDLMALVEADPARPATRTVANRQAYGEMRMAVVTDVGDRVTYPLVVPADAVLDLGYAIHTFLFFTDLPDQAEPVRLRIVFAEDDGDEHVLLDRRIDTRGAPADRRWFDARIDLGRWAHARGTLTILTNLDGDPGRRSPSKVLLSAPRILRPAADGAPSLLFVTIDCLRADHVGAYGYARPTTPRLDAFAAEGIRFTHAYTNGPMTLPALPQLFTSSLFPVAGQAMWLAPLVQAGIPTAGIVNNVWFKLWLSVYEELTFDQLVAEEGMDARAVSDRAIAWLDRYPRERFALYLHYLDAHSPYTLYPESEDVFGDPGYRGPVRRPFHDIEHSERYDAADRTRVVSLYDAGIRWVDANLGRVLDHLRRDGRLDRTVVVVTADHGEELWDHGRFFHGQSLHDELLHVPLLVRLPGAASAGTVISRPVSAIDVAPALVEWSGLRPPRSFSGRSLRAVIDRPDLPPDDHVATATIQQFPARYALRTPTHKLVHDVATGGRVLYDLVRDPAERRDVLGEQADVAAGLETRLDAARDVLAHRGYQLRVVGPAASRASFRLVLQAPKPGVGTFNTLDRTGGPADTRYVTSVDGEVLTVEGDADGMGRGFRFDRLVRTVVLRGSGEDPVRVLVETDGAAVPDALRLGPAGRPPANGAFNALDPALDAVEPPDCPPPPTGIRACLWRAAGTVTAPAPDEAARERLRALGYLQ